MEVILEFEVCTSQRGDDDDNDSTRIFVARRSVKFPGLPRKGAAFHLPCHVTAKCHNVFFDYLGGGKFEVVVGLGSVDVSDFDGFYRALRDDGFDLTGRKPLHGEAPGAKR